GNLRFRNQDIDERARQLGRGSDPDLQPRVGDSPPPRKGGDLLDFELNAAEDDVDLGSLARSEQPSSKKSGRSSSKPGPKSPGPVKTGSDSDVRLVPDGSNVDFVIASDSDIKMVQEPPPPRKSQVKRKSGPPSTEDSGVRMVPLEGDSDVRVTPDADEDSGVLLGSAGPRSASDSDIRLHHQPSTRHAKGTGGRAGPRGAPPRARPKQAGPRPPPAPPPKEQDKTPAAAEPTDRVALRAV